MFNRQVIYMYTYTSDIQKKSEIMFIHMISSMNAHIAKRFIIVTLKAEACPASHLLANSASSVSAARGLLLSGEAEGPCTRHTQIPAAGASGTHRAGGKTRLRGMDARLDVEEGPRRVGDAGIARHMGHRGYPRERTREQGRAVARDGEAWAAARRRSTDC